MLALLTSHLLAASVCSPAQWLAPRAPGDEVGIPFSGSDLPRACVPCRIEATYPGKTEPWQTHRWTLDSDGRLMRTEQRIGTSVFVTSCEQVAPNEARCQDSGVTSRLTLEKGRLQRHQRQDLDTRYERDAAGRVTRIVKRLQATGLATDAGAEEPWWREPLPDAGARVTRSFLFSITTFEYDSSGRLVSETEQRTEGETVRTRHYDALSRYVGTRKKGQTTWEEQLTWESPSRVVRKDSSSANVLHFDAQGRLAFIEEHLNPGVMGGAGDVRYFYGCDSGR